MKQRAAQDAALKHHVGVVASAGEVDGEKLAVLEADAAQRRVPEGHAREVALDEDAAFKDDPREGGVHEAATLKAAAVELHPGKAGDLDVDEGLLLDKGPGGKELQIAGQIGHVSPIADDRPARKARRDV